MGKEFIIRLIRASDDEFYSITRQKAKKMLSLPAGKRIAFFLANSEETSIHSTAQVDGFLDDSGNQTEECFWEDEGNEIWKTILDAEV